MKRETVKWRWESPKSQEAFVRWQGFPDNEESKKEINKIFSLIDLSTTSKLNILDLGCGNGRHSIELAKRGHNVLGIDIAEDYLNKAKEKAKDLDLNIDFKLQRGSQLQGKSIFDLVLAYYHTLGFMSDKELNIHFEKIYKALQKNGVFFLRTAGPKKIPGKSFERIKDWAEKDNKFILSEKYRKDGYRIEKCIEIDTVNNEITEYIEKQKAFSFKEVKHLLDKAGFQDIKCYSNLNGEMADMKNFGIYICKKH